MQVQTNGQETPVEAVEGALEDLDLELNALKHQFQVRGVLLGQLSSQARYTMLRLLHLCLNQHASLFVKGAPN